RETNPKWIIEIALIVLVHSRNHDEFRTRLVRIFALQSANHVMNRPSCSDVKLLALVTDLTLTEVGGVRLPQLVKAVFAQRYFDTTHKVIAVQQRCRTVQTCVARSDRGELQCLKTLSLTEVNTAVFRVCIAHMHRGEYILPQILA